MSSTPTSNLQLAKRGPIVSIVAYLLISIAKLIVGYSINSSSLIADGFNNVSDILSNVTLFIGLHLASKPADEDHRFGHWKIEDLASLITSFIMFIVGFQVLLILKVPLSEWFLRLSCTVFTSTTVDCLKRSNQAPSLPLPRIIFLTPLLLSERLLPLSPLLST